jgi:predicted nucleic acid-binding protein
MFKRKAIRLPDALAAVDEFLRIPIVYTEISLSRLIELAHALNIYAYDAYLLASDEQLGCPLLTLDRRLMDAARRSQINVVEVDGQ